MKEVNEYSDIEMLECIHHCFSTIDDCKACPFYKKGCLKTLDEWVKSYIQKLKRQEDDLK